MKLAEIYQKGKLESTWRPLEADPEGQSGINVIL